MVIILINYNTRHSVPAVMQGISEVKATTMAEIMAPSSKIRIVQAVVVIESPIVVFNGCSLTTQRNM